MGSGGKTRGAVLEQLRRAEDDAEGAPSMTPISAASSMVCKYCEKPLGVSQNVHVYPDNTVAHLLCHLREKRGVTSKREVSK